MKRIDQQQYRRALVVFTSDPVKEAQRKKLGKSPGAARQVYRAFLRHLLHIIGTAQSHLSFDLLFASDTEDLPNILRAAEIFPNLPFFGFIDHRGECFGSKFSYALSEAFSGGYDQVAIVGNDCLDLTPEIITQTFLALEKQETVLGPAKDGGFYLLGLRQINAELFKNVQWCGSQVLAQITRNIQKSGLSIAVLPTLKDIDSYRDLFNWLSETQVAGCWLAQYLQHLLFQMTQIFIYSPPFNTRWQHTCRNWQRPPPSNILSAS